MAKWKLYHNPKCSKSRQALEVLKESKADFEVVEYLKNPPTKQEIETLIKQLQGPLSSLVRTKEDEFSENPFDTDSEKEVIKNLLKTPKLLERPILQGNGVAVIGRPTENIENLIKAKNK